jgi:serine/threonine protein kinase
MLNKHAKTELEEYVLIDKADPKTDFYLGKPETCGFENSASNDEAIKKCTLGKDALKSGKKYKLIIQEDGGDNLEVFANKMHNSPRSEANKKTMKQFWEEAGRLFKGVKAMLNHGMMHHDLKPQNIVYNLVKNRCNIIDFGLMENIKTSSAYVRSNGYGFAFYHWNFTPESILLSRHFNTFQKYDSTQRLDEIKVRIESNSTKLGAFFRYVGKTSEIAKNEYLKEWRLFLLDDLNAFTFEQFIQKSFATFDLYGLGLTLMYVLQQTKHLTSERLYVKLNQLFERMITPNLSKRLEIAEAIQEYDNIFAQGSAQKESELANIEAGIKTIVKKIDVSDPSIKVLVNEDPEPTKGKTIKIRVKKNQTAKKCPPSKVLNPKTNRCNKVKTQKATKSCPAGKVLNPKTNRCNKVKTQKATKSCPAGKVLNPKTNRCNKVKIQKATKKCPPGKVLNTKTNRCNKIKIKN